ncbi:molecular chaperone DjlA [Mariniphaga sediminis]|uniref:Molecular chaperone DjlA n=1 Tax=Mariniphaga sediminis TaxID=1628158 RepID=A0A399CZ41_9BACT|nr:TerB family tellurite resistance protein [Mariniphaga sediminis]RIH64413.1 molecular chaperone DjlA [Mariniphaga sediminis]
MAKFGKWIGGGLGWAVGGPIGAIFGFVVGSIFDGSTGEMQVGKTTGYSGRTTTGGYVMSLLVLVAAVMKADGKVMKSELDYVKIFMRNNFGEASAQEAVKLLRDLLKQTIPVNEVCRQIKQNMNYSARLQLLHFLFGIAQADGHVEEKERQLIEVIAREMGLGNSDFESIQAMFVRNINADYKILEIEPTASNEDLKKAYRKMAMKYHPDKVSHLGDDFQKAAKDKFQMVNQAYENIKKERKIA